MSIDDLNLWHSDSPVTFILMGLILVFSCYAFFKPRFFSRMIFHPYTIVRDHEYYRWLTAGLVHNDIFHLLLNEFMLYLVGTNLEYTLRMRSPYGCWQFLLIYLFSGFAGVIVATVRRRNDFKYSSVGASGSIMGCMMSFMILRPDFIAFYLPVIGGVSNIYTALLYMVILIWYQRRTGNELIDNQLHFFGAAGGVLITLTLFYHQVIK